MKLRFLLLLCMASVASAQKYYDKTTIQPSWPPALITTQPLTAPSVFSVGTINEGFLGINSTVSGTVGNAVSFAPAYMKFTFTNFTKSVTPTFIPGFEVNTVFGGSGDLGGFSGALISTAQTATTGNKAAGYTANYVGGIFTSSAAATEGGTNTAGGAYGAIWGIDTVSTMTSGATNMSGIRGIEADIKLGAGATAREKTGFLAILESSDDADAALENTAYFAGKATTATSNGWGVAYQVGDYDGVFPMASTGTILGCYGHAGSGTCGTTTNGVDFVGGSLGLGLVTFTGYPFRSTGFNVDGSGDLNALTFSLTPGTAISHATWGTAGLGINVAAATYDDTTVGSGGVASDAAYGINGVTLTNTEGTANTLTNAITLHVAAPICGAGWTACTNLLSIETPGKIQGTGGANLNGGSITLNANSSTNITNIGTGTTSGTVAIGGGSDAVTVNSTTSGSVTTGAGSFTTLGSSGLFSPTLGITATGAALSFNDSSNFNTTINTGTSTGTVTVGQNTSAPSAIVLKGPVSFQAGTAYTGASWATTSPVLNVAASTLNDTTASGTITTEGAFTLQAPNFTSTGGASTTITNAANLYIAAPTCSGGVNCTLLWALYTPGKVRGTAGANFDGGTINLNASSNNTTSIGTGTTNALVTIGGGSNAVTINATTLTLGGSTVVTSSSPFTNSNAAFKLTGITTGTNADTVCMKSDGTLLIQAAACTISSLRFKTDVTDVQESTIPEIANMRVASFRMKDGGSNVDPNAAATQVGLIAENIAKVAPECAIYEPDMKTPKSYRQECVIALLVKGMQAQQAEITQLKQQIRSN